MDTTLYDATKTTLVGKGVSQQDADAAARIIASDKPGQERTPEQQTLVTRIWQQVTSQD
jgi:hypothetical protein